MAVFRIHLDDFINPELPENPYVYGGENFPASHALYEFLRIITRGKIENLDEELNIIIIVPKEYATVRSDIQEIGVDDDDDDPPSDGYALESTEGDNKGDLFRTVSFYFMDEEGFFISPYPHDKLLEDYHSTMYRVYKCFKLSEEFGEIPDDAHPCQVDEKLPYFFVQDF